MSAPIILTFHRMVTRSMRCAAKAEEKAAVRMNAAASDSSQAHAADDTSSAAHSPRPATPVAAGSRGNDGSPIELVYSGESDSQHDSPKAVRSLEPVSATKNEPSSKEARSNYRTHDDYRSLFDSEGEDQASSPAPAPASAHSPVREYDDGPRHREAKYRGTVTSVGTTQEELDRNVLRLASERKPWLLPEQLINNLSGETSAHH